MILEITTGYDLVLAGLGRVTVRPNDELLAGEPVGNMPAESGSPIERLYFELRQNGHGLDPRPWLSLDIAEGKRNMKKFAFGGAGRRWRVSASR